VAILGLKQKNSKSKPHLGKQDQTQYATVQTGSIFQIPKRIRIGQKKLITNLKNYKMKRFTLLTGIALLFSFQSRTRKLRIKLHSNENGKKLNLEFPVTDTSFSWTVP